MWGGEGGGGVCGCVGVCVCVKTTKDSPIERGCLETVAFLLMSIYINLNKGSVVPTQLFPPLFWEGIFP